MISFCSSLAIIIFLNIQKSSLPFFKIKAEELASHCLESTLKNKSFLDDNFNSEEFSVKKTVTINSLFNDCLLIRIIVFDGNKKKLHEMETSVLKPN